MRQHKNQKSGGLGLGNNGSCICNHCGTTIAHQRGIKCTDTVCPNCGNIMSRKESSVSNPPKTLRSSIRIATVLEHLCLGCGACINSCPFNAISMENMKAIIDPDTCRGCMKCVSSCPQQAITRK